MQKLLSAWCLFMILAVLSAGYFLYDTQISNASDLTINNTNKPKILIVPGHDNEFLGAETANKNEAEVNLKLGQYLYDFLDEEFDVLITRDQDGYTKDFQKFLNKKEKSIRANMNFIDRKMSKLTDREYIEPVSHNRAPDKMRFILHGINKYADREDVDLVLHIHFNDYPGRKSQIGKYEGFSIYIPQRNYDNHRESKNIAEEIYKNLRTWIPESTLPVESDTIIESTGLIAVGPANSLDTNSVLVEYDYIYMDTSDDRLNRMAEHTHRAIKNYFK